MNSNGCKTEKEKPNCELAGDPRCQMGAASPVIFVYAADGHWVEIRMLHRGEKLDVASCDLHNKIRTSPVALSCLLVAVKECTTLGNSLT